MRRELQVADGTTVSYSVIEGSSPAIVMLHGLAGSGRELLPTARALTGRRAIVIDQRGHGFSTRIPDTVEREAFVSDVVTLVERKESGPVDLVGHSMGAHTAMLVAAERPNLVRRLVLLECDAGGASVDSVRELENWLGGWPPVFRDRTHAREHLGTGALAAAMLDDLQTLPSGLRPRFDAGVMKRVAQTLMPQRWAEWERVRSTTLVMYADGGMFSPEQRSRFVGAGRDVHRVDLIGASHDAHLDAFDQWVHALRGFLLDP